MKTEKNILLAFLLNLAFSVLEVAGGVFTGSVAIISDAMHDIGDAMSIGLSYFLEKKSKRQPDENYTYGYTRYSVLGSVITSVILLTGSVAIICNAAGRLVTPTPIHYDGMILLAVIGICVNMGAALITRKGDSLNQKAVNLHMLEDVLGWVVVLVGGVIMRFTDLTVIDPLMSIGVAVFILIHSVKNLKEAVELLLEKTPRGIKAEKIREHICCIEGVLDVHHIHIWSMDGQNNYATMHVVTAGDHHMVKENIREELAAHGIGHATLELESPAEYCCERDCHIDFTKPSGHHHHHH